VVPSVTAPPVDDPMLAPPPAAAQVDHGGAEQLRDPHHDVGVGVQGLALPRVRSGGVPAVRGYRAVADEMPPELGHVLEPLGMG